MKLWVLLLFLAPLWVHAQGLICPTRLAISSQTIEQLNLKAPGEVRLRGLVVKYKGYPPRLAITPYMFGPGHDLMMTLFINQYPEEARLEGVWGGEMRFVDGILQDANCTSGFLYKEKYNNDPDILAKYLASSGNKIPFSPALRIAKYDHQHRHLSEQLNEIINNSENPVDESAIHEIQNKRIAFQNFLEVVTIKTKTLANEATVSTELLDETFRAKTMSHRYYHVIDIYLQLLAKDGIQVGRSQYVKFANKLNRREPITVAEVRAMSKLNQIWHSFTPLSPSQRPIDWWEPYVQYVTLW